MTSGTMQTSDTTAINPRKGQTRPLSLLATLCALATGIACAAANGPDVSAPPPASLQTGQSVAVIGVRTSGDAGGDLGDAKVGFGLNQLLAEELYDSGHFRLLEGKAAGKTEVVKDLVESYWVGAREDYTMDDLDRVLTELDVGLLSYAVLSYSRVSRQSMNIGVFNKVQQTLKIDVTACLYGAEIRIPFCRAGRGEAEAGGQGAIYEFAGTLVDFQTNAAGQATKKALSRAVTELVGELTFSE